MTTNEHSDRIALFFAIASRKTKAWKEGLESLTAIRAHISELEEKSKSGSPCVRCGAPYLPHGQCSRHAEGCQGGRGESGSPADPPVSPAGSANRESDAELIDWLGRVIAYEDPYNDVLLQFDSEDGYWVALRPKGSHGTPMDTLEEPAMDLREAIRRAIDSAPTMPTPPNPGAETEVTKGLPDVAGLRAQIAALSEQLEFDRSAVADCLSAANRAIDGRHWLTEGRGPYEWNDDKWHEEFYAAAVEIRGAIAPLTKIAADWKGCPQKGEDVAKARIDLQAQVAALTVERAAFVDGAERMGRDLSAAIDSEEKLTVERDQARADWAASVLNLREKAERVNALEQALRRERDAYHRMAHEDITGPYASECRMCSETNAALSTVAPKSNASTGKTCTCHSHQFVACRGKENLGIGWVCADEQAANAGSPANPLRSDDGSAN